MCLSAFGCLHSWIIVSHYGCEWTNPSVCLCVRNLKTLRERSTRQTSPPWRLRPPRMAPRFTSCPSPRSPCLSPNSPADQVRTSTTPWTQNKPTCNCNALLLEVFLTIFIATRSFLITDRNTKSLFYCFALSFCFIFYPAIIITINSHSFKIIKTLTWSFKKKHNNDKCVFMSIHPASTFNVGLNLFSFL